MSSWSEVSSKIHNYSSHGEIFNNGEPIPGCNIAETTCEYCGRTVLAVWDKGISSWYPYLGNQAVKANVYRASPIIQAMRKYYHVEGEPWTIEKGNNLLNIHARAHSDPNDWSKRAHPNGIKILCNQCFQKTYNRIKVLGNNGIMYSLSVIPSRGETIYSVMEDLGIQGKVIGKGAINNY